VQAGAFENGKHVGVKKRYYNNGQLWDEGNYDDGKKIGEWKLFDKVGAPTQTKFFKVKN